MIFGKIFGKRGKKKMIFEEVIGKAREAAKGYNELLKGIPLALLAVVSGKLEDCKAAEEAAEKMGQEADRARAAVARAYALAGKLERARGVAEKITDPLYHWAAWWGIAEKSDNWEDSKAAQKAAQEIPGQFTSLQVMFLMFAYVLKDMGFAYREEEISDKFPFPFPWNMGEEEFKKKLRSYAQEGGREALEEMLKEACPLHKVMILAEIAKATGDFTEALEVAEREVEEFNKWRAYLLIAEALKER
jgi:hypothetical protein